ncbi:FAD-binding oxidoreductase [Saccharothrix obliqua]|uniref:FAD-binding oxidoreductase n=1 Tax=Saccharothrix obliqua TaxID=2861747 RepID=UPI001C5CD55D|nr:FAD-binding protein [Saccharothrix obliqua]MBW4721489.1 FAD-binding protein [Saccharothrix obliqua]
MGEALSRRGFLAGAAVAAGVVATAAPAAASAGEPAVVTPGDRRYGDLVRGMNHRWVATPDRVVVVRTPDQVVTAVRGALRDRLRLSVRSGGHCYEAFAAEPGVGVVIDVSDLTGIRHDPRLRAVEVEAGAVMGDVYATLFKRWGVTLPGGSCYSVGAGGHVAGGGYGPLSRLHGLVVDHLYAVEVVVADHAHGVRKVVATREPDDPNRDLWWAHTGGGGGSFGIVTRYWFRTTGASGADPADLLPRPPASVWVGRVEWPWASLGEDGFHRLLGNYARWCAANAAPGNPLAGVFARLNLVPRQTGPCTLAVQVDGGLAAPDRVIDDLVAAVGDGVAAPPRVVERRALPWLHGTGWQGLWANDTTSRSDFKSSYLRSWYDETQVSALHHHFTRPDYGYPTARVSMASYGARVNAVAPGDTAVAHRDSVLKLLWGVAWTDPAEDDRHIAWLRELYSDVHADTGGVPVPNDVTDGCFINYPDIDLGDPAHNRSAVPWHDLYFKDNYPRLQRVKARWDAADVFHHAQSVRLPG